MNDEKEYRRPEWREGVNVVLGDNQAWALPRVLIRLVPTGDGYEHYVKVGDVRDKSFAQLIKDRDDAVGERDDSKFLRAESQMGRALLLANYDLDDDAVQELMQFNFGDPEADPEGARMREEVLDVALCRRERLPKPTGGGA